MTNRLSHATSPYLRSAAHQPVHWFPWGDDAFAAARRHNRPILLDIGAVWCHWCHVMDRESYESDAIAEILNRDFVCVKVDRDERPDVDLRYQRAVQAFTGQGGWPLTAFLTPEGQVFYGGTYFPPDGRWGRPGFADVLRSVAQSWQTARDKLEQQALALRRALAEDAQREAQGVLDAALLSRAEERIVSLFDPEHGGFGRAPKFPHPAGVRFLLHRWGDEPTPQRRRIIEQTLGAMARGGIHDHLGGGFHRYSTDRQWIVPHFEKMLYDNAELLRIYSDAHAALGDTAMAAAARGIVVWVKEVMADPLGGYAASQDADVGLDDDGDYFTWTREEIAEILRGDEFLVACEFWDIGTAGEMQHDPSRNVLFTPAMPEQLAIRLGKAESEVRALIASAAEKLRAARAGRPTPQIDRTVYTNWSAMMAGAMLRAAAVLGDAWARDHALLTLARLRREAPEPDRVAHGGGAAGVLDDQVQVAAAALDAFEATGDSEWLAWSVALMDRVLREHAAPEGGLRDIGEGHDRTGLLADALRPFEDAPTPSPNGVAAITCARLWHMTGEARWREGARALVQAFVGRAADYGLHAATLLIAADWLLHDATHLAVVAPIGDAEGERMHRLALASWRPRCVVVRITEREQARSLPPALAAIAGSVAPNRGIVCRGMTCLAPVEGELAWKALLAETASEAVSGER